MQHGRLLALGVMQARRVKQTEMQTRGGDGSKGFQVDEFFAVLCSYHVAYPVSVICNLGLSNNMSTIETCG